MTDEWSGFADLLANLIEKYACVLDIENPSESTHSEKRTAAIDAVKEDIES